MKLFGSTLSPFVRKVAVYAVEKGLELPLEAAGLGRGSPEFMRASPFGKMPAFTDGDFAISDSTAIITYLEAKYPEPPLIPADPAARARTIWFEEFADTMLIACGGKMFFNRFVSPTFLKRPGDLAAADAAQTNDWPPLLDYLEGVATGDYLVGDALTLADIAVASAFATLSHIEVGADAARHPNVAAWLGRILSRPSFAAVMERERAFVAQVREAA